MSELKNHQKMIDSFKKAVLEYIDGKISVSSLINTLDTSVSGDLIAITCLKKATQENEIN